jgi:hypothetical protein
MQDDFLSQSPRAPARRGVGGRWLGLALLAALALGGVGGVLAANRLGFLKPSRPSSEISAASVPTATAGLSATPVPGPSAENQVGQRLAELEQRLTQLNLQAQAASGNAGRAESLLIAAAARRAIERGMPLDYLADQLKLRFGNAQPNAVETLVEVSGNPVTLDALQQELAALGTALRSPPASAGTLDRVRQELSSLFIVRRAGGPRSDPAQRLERALGSLKAGRVDAAIAEVERMPGQAAAGEWLARARRYVRAERALDLIETAAILEPRELPDGRTAPPLAPPPAAGGF